MLGITGVHNEMDRGYYAFLVLTSLYFIVISSRATPAFDYWQWVNSTQFEKGIRTSQTSF